MQEVERLDAREISRRYGLGGGARIEGPVARGEVGQVWRLTTESGVYAVKQAFEPPDLAEAEDDASFQDRVAVTGVPMPPLLRTTEGGVLADIGSTRIRVYGWVELGRPDRTLDPSLVGSVVAAVHRVRYRGVNGLHYWYQDPVGAGAWDQLIAELHQAGAPFAERLAERRDELLALERLIEVPGVVQTCHRDLFADNVLPTPGGGVCIIDWENSGLADPGGELAVVLFEFACGSSARVRALYDAYRDEGGVGVVERPQDFSMLIAQIGHIGESACRSWLDPRLHHERPRNEARVDEFLTDGVTCDLIAMTLDSIAT